MFSLTLWLYWKFQNPILTKCVALQHHVESHDTTQIQNNHFTMQKFILTSFFIVAMKQEIETKNLLQPMNQQELYIVRWNRQPQTWTFLIHWRCPSPKGAFSLSPTDFLTRHEFLTPLGFFIYFLILSNILITHIHRNFLLTRYS